MLVQERHVWERVSETDWKTNGLTEYAANNIEDHAYEFAFDTHPSGTGRDVGGLGLCELMVSQPFRFQRRKDCMWREDEDTHCVATVPASRKAAKMHALKLKSTGTEIRCMSDG